MQAWCFILSHCSLPELWMAAMMPLMTASLCRWCSWWVSSGELCILCHDTLMQIAGLAERKRSIAFTPPPFSPGYLAPTCLRRKANAACACPWWWEEGAEGVFNLLVCQRLRNELGVRITQVCLCVPVQLCLISKTAVVLSKIAAQGRILVDLNRPCRKKASKHIFLKWKCGSAIRKQTLVRNLEQSLHCKLFICFVLVSGIFVSFLAEGFLMSGTVWAKKKETSLKKPHPLLGLESRLLFLLISLDIVQVALSTEFDLLILKV